MAEQQQAATPDDTPGDLRRTLIKRLAVAGGLVAVLLGVLAFFDYLATPEEVEAPPAYTQPVPVAPRKEITQQVKPTDNLPEPPQPEAAAEKPADKAADKTVDKANDKPAKAAEATPPPSPPPVPERTARPEIVAPSAPPVLEAAARTVAQPRPPAIQQPVIQPPVAPSRPVLPQPPREGTAAPVLRISNEGAAATPAAPLPAKRIEAPEPKPQPAPLRLFAGYLLQAGVFTSMQRAEEIHAKLTLNGIPSTLEARVQVGPFQSKEEAAAAREKLKALNIDAVILPPAKAAR